MPEHYMSRIGHYNAGEEVIDPAHRPFEFMMNALRLKSGVDEWKFQQMTGLSIDNIAPILEKHRKKGLIEPSRIQCTERGFIYLNDILSDYVVD